MKKAVIGILAHVDSGKTTLTEAMLYTAGNTRKLGRVDHKDAFLDTYSLEREKGITIFSKQAMLTLQNAELTLLDTPGHVDFSAEMERTLSVLDYAILVISGTDGVQGHTETLWYLLQKHKIPTFLFVNKQDLAGFDKQSVLKDLNKRLSGACVDFTPSSEEFFENAALCDEVLMEQYLETGEISHEALADAIANRKIFPCYFGSALKVNGIEAFLNGLQEYILPPKYEETGFGARVFKITRDPQGNRLTHLKITKGSLKVRTLLKGGKRENEWEEKVNQIRIYSGVRYQTVDEAAVGTVCAVTGLEHTFPGEGLGEEQKAADAFLEPVLTYQVILPEGYDVHRALIDLRQLEEEDPQLHVAWNEILKELHIQLMGEVQLEVLGQLIFERFGQNVTFGAGHIVYKETIESKVEGVGHFEPLRHYAEVHLLMEPAPRGSGIVLGSECSEDVLDRNWQRLILTHLYEKEHLGVLTCSPLTDVRISLVAGRAHIKHTEGGDFRQATYRAVRQGLMQAKSVLLEPYYQFRLEVPSDMVGRAISDIQMMNGTFSGPEIMGESAVLVGRAPVAKMVGYASDVTVYTRGRGRLSCSLKGYDKCHNEKEVIREIGYQAERDTENPADSVFCSHGAGFVVKWQDVPRYMHVQSGLQFEKKEAPAVQRVSTGSVTYSLAMEKELEEIFKRTYGERKEYRDRPAVRPQISEYKTPKKDKNEEPIKDYLLVDGYNIIFAWEELREIAKDNLDGARDMLIHILNNYQGFKPSTLILVFDAYKVPGNRGAIEKYHNIYVVYTKEKETADMYIEKATYAIPKRHRVRVATSDALEQMIILGHGAVRMSAGELKLEVEQVNQEISRILEEKRATLGNRAFHDLPQKLEE